MKVIAGLGNPGPKYEKTRHNIGFRVVEWMARESGISIQEKKFRSLIGRGRIKNIETTLILPQAYMNCSGEALQEWMQFYKIEASELIVVHDDLDLAFGKMKLGFQSSAAGHNGVASIIDRLGTNAFYRLRFGIGRPALKGQEVDYVLSPFEEEEDPLNHLIEKAGRVVINLMEEGFEKAQQMCHNRDTA
ncbi:MAG: aminoacyl-tRNA hydrolase [Deltaproteobacteria bacterium RIFCSPLOWO2_02_FULL_50_16]|nr:MAG: aminoacyl-tRNA hydrolase [Deltaproteobacteria bacterium GWA2_50_8]OGQ26256.1 MAG: aminoacyl-tRNA hydrolase [Deltaproteobacteria bacterium RIFCSPHIGHO2_02_FULL_50_15]OGQ56267.1 MAG: aminoacyl-tRNA hydrolase [Deltaproteobacteria bacterium RIFCSPLOWO2_02_FULL_50_16]OGQ65838.1 MAG: aminoacyl-tRNA hydrolase [Deltaproteobacteria bacterium RIFCSPLOWO2_12_FULL_50_11]